jgi:predicted transcriptional regulator
MNPTIAKGHTIVGIVKSDPIENGENCMSQLTRIAKVLRRNNTGSGITPRQVAKMANVPLANVYKRVSDLRILEGRRIYSNHRTVNGQRKMFYRFAANS